MSLPAPRGRPPSGGRSTCAQAGFTLVELVIVMTLLALLTAVGAARFADREPFAVQGMADQLRSGLRMAQASAIAQRRTVHVTLGASPLTMTVCLDAACSQPLPAPGGDGAWLQDAQGLTLSAGTSFSFDGAGTPSLASSLALSVRSADGATVSPPLRIEATTGHVH
jgi:MSHA pilin protein MshC